MNITVLANRDLASNLALNLLLPSLAQQHRIQVFLSSKVGGKGHTLEELELLTFFEQTLFTDILFPVLDAGRMGSAPHTFNELSHFMYAPITSLNQVNSSVGLASLQASKPDLIICIRYGGILKEKAIAVPRRGVINLHSGLLPDYRGVMATFRAMLNGDSEIGTTLHTINDSGIDTGNIIATTRHQLDTERSYLWNVLQLYPRACEQILDTVAKLTLRQAIDSQPQPQGGAYYTFPTRAELKEFRELGFRLFDVNEITELAQQFPGTN
jgi:methionyl-tRNA formyltransferase